MSSFILSVSSILTIVICTLSGVSSDCTSCCILGTGCSTAYNGESGQCCANGLSSYCCPTSSLCVSNGECRILYWGMSLPVLIGVLAGILIVVSLMIAVLCRLCRPRRPAPVTSTMLVASPFHSSGAYQLQTSAAAPYKH